MLQSRPAFRSRSHLKVIVISFKFAVFLILLDQIIRRISLLKINLVPGPLPATIQLLLLVMVNSHLGRYLRALHTAKALALRRPLGCPSRRGAPFPIRWPFLIFRIFRLLLNIGPSGERGSQGFLDLLSS